MIGAVQLFAACLCLRHLNHFGKCLFQTSTGELLWLLLSVIMSLLPYLVPAVNQNDVFVLNKTFSAF